MKKQEKQTKESEVRGVKKMKQNKRNNTNCPCRNNRGIDNFSSSKHKCGNGRKWFNKTSRKSKQNACK